MTALRSVEVELPSPAEAASRARWLESMSRIEQAALHHRPLRLVERDFRLWRADHERRASTAH